MRYPLNPPRILNRRPTMLPSIFNCDVASLKERGACGEFGGRVLDGRAGLNDGYHAMQGGSCQGRKGVGEGGEKRVIQMVDGWLFVVGWLGVLL
mmetsp:Transcript_62949/g.74459  ORF Transcript_62949/g.74459 Transcript_62949/m.74459 type:complete len:94 (+) Transcript_62949:69-350(+)